MEKRMEQLKFMVDLNWKIRFVKSFDKMFDDLVFVEFFNQFIITDIGKKWLLSDNGRAYQSWQNS